jgi:hypothetical protein
MSISEKHIPSIGEKAVLVIPGNYQPIHLQEMFGAIFLGIFAVIFLIGWIRSEARYRTLIMQQVRTNTAVSVE